MKKKLFVIMLAVCMAFVFAGCQKQASDETDSQNPTMNIVGPYQDEVSGRATLTVAAGEEGTHDAVVVINWGNSATQSVQWEMKGTYDADKGVITYKNATKTTVTTNAEGEEEDATVEYKDGTGTFTVGDDNVITWQDDKEDAGAGCQFVFDNGAE